jgi:hypothetical protein
LPGRHDRSVNIFAADSLAHVNEIAEVVA